MNRRRWGEEDEGGTCHSNAEIVAVSFANVFNEVDSVLETQVGGNPFFLSSGWVWRDMRQRYGENRTHHRGEQEYFGRHIVWLPEFNDMRRSIKGSGQDTQTWRAASTWPSSAFVQVRCKRVVRLWLFCVREASSMLLSFVDPPAPQVILTARGLSRARREMRERRLSKPWSK